MEGGYTPMGYFQGPLPGYAPGAPMGGRPRHSGENSIWVGDLDGYMDENFLRNVVNLCGWGADITRIKVVRDRYTGHHAGYGFFDAVSPEAAQRVLHSGSGMPIPGTNRCWRLNMGRSASGGQVSTETNVYVGDLDPATTDFELMSAFRPRYASVRHAKIVCNNYGQSKGFGFVRFADAGEAERAVLEMQGFTFHDKQIKLSLATGRPKAQRTGYGPYDGGSHKRPRNPIAPDDPNNTTLFIGGTGPHVTEEILWREFGIFGELEAVRVPVNKTGFAFVRFKTRADAERAKEELSGTHFISLNAHKAVRLEWAAEQLSIPRGNKGGDSVQQQINPSQDQQQSQRQHPSLQSQATFDTSVATSAGGSYSGNQQFGNSYMPLSGTSTGLTGAGVSAATGSTSDNPTPMQVIGEGTSSRSPTVGLSEYQPKRDGQDPSNPSSDFSSNPMENPNTVPSFNSWNNSQNGNGSKSMPSHSQAQTQPPQ